MKKSYKSQGEKEHTTNNRKREG